MSKEKSQCPRCKDIVTLEELQLSGLCDNCYRDDMAEDGDFDDEMDFDCCDICDRPDACRDFGCAIKNRVRKNIDNY